MGVRDSWSQTQGAPAKCDGVDHAPAVRGDETQIVIGDGIFRCQADSAAQQATGILCLPILKEEKGKVGEILVR